MQRDVTAEIRLEAAGPARLALAVAVAQDPARERLVVTQGSRSVAVRPMLDHHGGRVHIADVTAGEVVIEYAATVEGAHAPVATDLIDEIRYLRPSRYAESDVLRPFAVAEFGGLVGKDLVDAVSSWVGVNLAYLSGSSLPTDGAVRTLLARQGVCRDFAHLVVALLRALDVPARFVSVYAPGLSPMDFHAVAEAHIDGAWYVVDATALAPRATFVRIATGRDAADTAFLSSHGADVTLTGLTVSAVADELPTDDLTGLVELR